MVFRMTFCSFNTLEQSMQFQVNVWTNTAGQIFILVETLHILTAEVV